MKGPQALNYALDLFCCISFIYKSSPWALCSHLCVVEGSEACAEACGLPVASLSWANHGFMAALLVHGNQ